MKKYRVTASTTNPECIDLVNINDDSDRIPAAPFEFANGEIISEGDFHLERHAFVDDESAGSMLFAFPGK